MTIDSAVKRASAASIKPIKKVVIPDGTMDATDRLVVASLYSGISAVYGRALKNLSDFTGRELG